MWSSRWTAIVGALAATVAFCGCESDTTTRSESGYCAAVSDNAIALNSPSIATSADIDATVAMYHSIAEIAPLAIEREWTTLADAYETASTVEPTDQASVQAATDAIRGSQPSAAAISDYSAKLCNVMIGTTTVPVPVTLPATSTSAG